MALFPDIKGFADVLNEIYSNNLSSLAPNEIAAASEDLITSVDLPRTQLVLQLLVASIKNFSSLIAYLLTFQWFRDFSYFPIIAPEIVNVKSQSIFSDTFFTDPASHLFSLTRGESLASVYNAVAGAFGATTWHSLKSAFFNSFFFSLPFSLSSLVTLRRLFSQGASAAVASTIGAVAAHSFVLLGVIYGLRFVIIPYFALQPLTFVFGLFVIGITVNEMLKERKMYLVPFKDISSLVRIGALNFCLALCEETSIFHSFKHLTLNPFGGNTETSYLSAVYANTYFQFLFVNAVYLFAFVLGHFLFSFAFCYLLLKGNEQLCSFTGWSLPRIAHRINRFVLVFIVVWSFSSFPYYGLDYLFTKIGGFLPEDPALSNTIFSPTTIKARNTNFKSRPPANQNEVTPLEIDSNYFDRGMYLNSPKEEKEEARKDALHLYESTENEISFPYPEEDFLHQLNEQERDTSNFSGTSSSQSAEKDKLFSDVGDSLGKNAQDFYEPADVSQINQPLAGIAPSLSIEELNYQGEYAWLMRHERARRSPEEVENRTSENGTSLNSLFQKPKTHFKELRLKKQDKQAEAALKERSQRGHIANWKEGRLPGEESPFAVSPSQLTRSLRQSRTREKRGGENATLAGMLDSGTNNANLNPATNKEETSDLFSRSQQANTGYRKSAQQGVSARGFEKELLEKELKLANELAEDYSTAFTDTFSEEANSTPPELLPVEAIIKKRYLLNPVYRALLSTDIDSFIARQPSHYRLAENQEYSLFKKRQLLEKYYNWLRYYSPLESTLNTTHFDQKTDVESSAFSNQRSTALQGGLKNEFLAQRVNNMKNKKAQLSVPPNNELLLTKSFVDTLYHQQFKGTLSKATRLFKLSFDGQENPNRERVLSYDQALYQNKDDSKKRQQRHNTAFNKHPSLHEELFDSETSKAENLNVSPFMEEANSSPIYGGWDNERRGFIVTNRFLSE